MTRLSAACDCITKTDVFADVGCDHGYVARYVMENRLANKVIASDISEKCLNKARANLSGAEFALCDGIKYDCTEAAVCGMGGYEIIKILSEATCAPQRLILIPHTDVPEVRRWLGSNGYKISRDFTVKDKGRYYSVIAADKGEPLRLDELHILFGAFFEGDEITHEYLNKKLEEIKKYPPTAENIEKTKFLKEAVSLRN